MTQKLLYRVPEVAQMIGVSKSEAYNLVKLGILPTVRMKPGGRSLRVPHDRLMEWIANGCQPAQEHEELYQTWHGRQSPAALKLALVGADEKAS